MKNLFLIVFTLTMALHSFAGEENSTDISFKTQAAKATEDVDDISSIGSEENDGEDPNKTLGHPIESTAEERLRIGLNRLFAENAYLIVLLPYWNHLFYALLEDIEEDFLVPEDMEELETGILEYFENDILEPVFDAAIPEQYRNHSQIGNAFNAFVQAVLHEGLNYADYEEIKRFLKPRFSKSSFDKLVINKRNGPGAPGAGSNTAVAF